MHRVVRNGSAAACLFALFLTMGGHWALLQSLAWSRMLVDYSRDSSLSSAIAKTFDGQHPCPMCKEVEKGRAEDEKQAPPVKWEKQPEILLDQPLPSLRVPPHEDLCSCPFASGFPPQLIPAPPKPPPRLA